MDHKRAVVAYRYHVMDVDTWNEDTVEVFYRRLRMED